MTDQGSRAVVLAGGGIDSTLCMHLLRRDGIPFRAMHIDYGQPAAGHEWAAVQRVTRGFNVSADQVSVRGSTKFEPGEVSGRNASFIFLALMHLRPGERLICLGIHAGTPFYDCSKSFFDTASILVAEYTDAQIGLIAPLQGFTKPEIIGYARSIGMDIRQTYSCQRGMPGGCGKCHSCKDREVLGC